jgi:phosphate transport system permease protein
MKLRLMDKTFVYLTGVAVLIILALLAMIVGNIVANGWTRISWEFLSGDPREGMTAGGIFPAIFGTALLVLLMTIFVRRPNLHALPLVALRGG